MAVDWTRRILAADSTKRPAKNHLTLPSGPAPQAMVRSVGKSVVHRRHGMVIHACFTEFSCHPAATFHDQLYDFIEIDGFGCFFTIAR
jgi:hypothetical protein